MKGRATLREYLYIVGCMYIGEEKRVRKRTTLVYKEKKRTGREMGMGMGYLVPQKFCRTSQIFT